MDTHRNRSTGLLTKLRSYFRTDLYARFFPYLRPYNVQMACVLLLTVAESCLGLLEPWPLKVLIDSGLSGAPPPHLAQHLFRFMLDSPRKIIFCSTVAQFLIFVAARTVGIITEYAHAYLSSGMNLKLSGDLVNRLLRLPFRYHDKTAVGDCLYRINSDSSFVSAMLWNNLREFLISSLMIAGIFWMVVRLDWMLAVLAVSIAPIQYGSVSFYNKVFKSRVKRIREMETTTQSIMTECLSCLRVIKAFVQEDREERRIDDHRWTTLQARLSLEFHESWFSFGVRCLSKLDCTAILVLGSLHVLKGQFTVGELLVVVIYVGQIQNPIERVGDVLQSMQSSLVSAERVVEVLDVDPDNTGQTSKKPDKPVQGIISFESVSFSYRPGARVLSDVSFNAAPGEIIAIVGPTGSGKSTFANLLLRFYEPDSGRITLDGSDIRDIALPTLRQNIGLVAQETVLFSGTIRENIGYSRPNIGIEEIVAAAKDASVHEAICAMPDGYESQIGERGIRLSGGERQRIAIARAFLKNAPVLVLDEPTSSLDPRTESSLIEALERLMLGRTTLIITHRLSTIRSAHRILVIEKGTIAQSGTHDKLSAIDGPYSLLIRVQASVSRRARSESGVA